MVLDDDFERFQDDSIAKQIKIEFDEGIITNKELHQEQFELKESLCSEQTLRFGCCEASVLKFKISNIFQSLKDKWITASMTIEGRETKPFSIGKYKVNSDVPTANKKYRDVTAYDVMYDILNAEVSTWYNTILPNNDSKVTLKTFRDSFFDFFGIEQEEVVLPNDDVTVEKTVEPSNMSGKTVICSICELNGCFGHIGREGKFKYVFLKEITKGLFPMNTLYPKNDIYPEDNKGTTRVSASIYISAEYEDFETEKLTGLVIRKEENDVGGEIGGGNNRYIIQDNFLVYGKSTDELRTIARNIFAEIKNVWYRPLNVFAKGNPCFEVGDGIQLSTKYAILYSYILQRTFKGAQALKDTYEASGEQYQGEEVNSYNESIIQLKGKTNTLIRTVDETNSRITDTANSLYSEISQTASQIRLEVADTAEGLSSRITVNANSITSEVTRATAAEGNLSSTITQTADSIRTEVSQTYETKTDAGYQYTTLSSRITQTAESITSEVTRASEAEGNLSSRITQNAEQIDLRVTRDGVVSAINISPETITIAANRINVDGLLATTQFQAQTARITNLETENLEINGDISALSARIGSIESDYVTAGQLNAVSARIGTVEADYITSSELSAVNARFNNLNASNLTAGTISADRLSGDVVANVLQGNSLTVDRITANSAIDTNDISTSRINGHSTSWTEITVNGRTYTVLTG